MNTIRSLFFCSALLPAMALAGSIRFEGNTAVPTSDLNRVEIRLGERGGQLVPDSGGESYSLGQLDASRLSAEAVAQVVRAVSAHYQSRNILATRAEVSRSAFVTAQGGGDLVVRVVEGRIGVVRVSAAEGSELSEATRERVLAASPAQVGGSLEGHSLEASLAALNRFSASQVQPVLYAEPEGLVLEYRVRQPKPWSFGYTVDNFGSERTGEVRHSLTLGATGLAQSDDRLTVTGIFTADSGSLYLRGEYFAPLGRQLQHRLRLSAYHASYTAEDVGVTLFDFEGDSHGVVAGYEYTLWSEGNRFLDLGLGAHWMNSSQDQSSVGIASADGSFFLPYVELKLSQQSAQVSWMGGIRLETNVGGTDDLEKLGRLGRYLVSDEFTLGRVFGGVRAFFDRARVHEFLANGAYVSSLGGDRLPAPFLNVVGGHSTVRGYRVAAVSGDASASAQLEYRFHALRLGQVGSAWDAAIALFYDIGAAENEDPLPFEFDDTIASYGVGLHLSSGDRFRASVEYARAAKDMFTPYESTESGDSEVYVTASLKF